MWLVNQFACLTPYLLLLTPTVSGPLNSPGIDSLNALAERVSARVSLSLSVARASSKQPIPSAFREEIKLRSTCRLLRAIYYLITRVYTRGPGRRCRCAAFHLAFHRRDRAADDARETRH